MTDVQYATSTLTGDIGYSVTELTGADGTPLALHRWAPPAPVSPRGLLYYVHGIQSHAGWLFESGPALARRAVVTYALDRRGSGRSGGMRGDLPAARVVLDDYLRGLHAATDATPGLPVTVLGQSFGGSIVAATVAGGGLAPDRLVYCTPALGQQRARHTPDRLAELRGLTGTEYTPVALDDEDYTDQPRYLDFMANDHLMLRQLTDRTRATMVEIESRYLDRSAPAPVPTWFVRTLTDPIIALDQAERVLAVLHHDFRTVTLPVGRHYVEFSDNRRQYWDWLADLVAAPVPVPDGGNGGGRD